MGPVNSYDEFGVDSHEEGWGRLSTESYPKESSFVDSPQLIWTWKESLLSIPLGLIVTGTILGNFLVLYSAVTRSHTLRLPTHFIIANLALADFLVGVLVMPFLATLQVTGIWYFGEVYCEAWTVIHFWLCSASILSTCAVCIERYIGVRYPLRHKEIMNSQRICGLVICVWVQAGLLAFASLYIWPEPKSKDPYECKINQQIGHVLLAVVGILYVPAAVMIILYWRIYMIATTHLKFMKHNSAAAAPGPLNQKDTQDNKRASNGLSLAPVSDIATTETSFSSSPRNSTDLDVTFNQSNGQKKGSEVSGISSSSSVTTTSCSKSLVKNAQSKKQINLAKRLSLLVGVLLASYLPFFTLYMIMAFHPGSINLHVFFTFGWIRYFNSCLNPFIYAFAVPAYRKAMKEIVLNGFGKLKMIKS